MNRTQPPPSIVVGIDGSDAAVRAAEWAVDEAASRDLPLRLVHIIEPGSEAIRLETEYANIALQSARAAAENVSLQVRIETAVKRGDIGKVLTRESLGAEMICIGTASRDGLLRSTAGSLAARLVRSAHCPVAVIGIPDARVERRQGCLVVIVTGSPTGDVMVREALDEARLRKLSLMVVETRSVAGDDPDGGSLAKQLTQMQQSYPDVALHCVAVRTDLGAFLAQIAPSVAMTLIDGSGLDGYAPLACSAAAEPALQRSALPDLNLVPAHLTGKVVMEKCNSIPGGRAAT